MNGLTVTNQKGGVGKSTTVVNLACALGEKKRSVLAIDMDPQCSMTRLFGVNPEELEGPSIAQAMVGEASIDQATLKLSDYVSIVPGHSDLASVQRWLVSTMRREEKLRLALEGVIVPYDYLLIDTGPNMLDLTINAIVATRMVMIPVKMSDWEAVEGAVNTLNAIAELRGAGIDVELFGVLPTIERETRLAAKAINEALPEYGTVIPLSTPDLGEAEDAAFAHKPLFWLNPDCRVSEAHRRLAAYVIERSEAIDVSAAASREEAAVNG